MTKSLSIGMIGLSEGNGHPYSWSAIFNGYDPAKMKDSGFPTIAEYLAKRSFPADQIADARVTHIWTQDRDLSQKIAETCFIDLVVPNFEDLAGEVDAVILARDDHENHYDMAKPFLEAGLPVFVDKPLAISVADAQKLFALEQYEGQLFTCSSLRYAEEFYLSSAEEKALGELRRIDAVTVKSWDKYAVHIIEPVLHYLGGAGKPVSYRRKKYNNSIYLETEWNDGPITSFQALGPEIKKRAIAITYKGDKKEITKEFHDSFSAFKTSLSEFVKSVRDRKRLIPMDETLKVIGLIEEGLKDVG